MTVVTPQQYREQTGDTTHYWSEILGWLTRAQSLVEGRLARLLESAERTEDMTIERNDCRSLVLYPSAYPVTVVPSGYRIEFGRRVVGGVWPWDMLVEPFSTSTLTASLTYTGGYTTATLPAALRDAIIDVARAQSTVGDASVYPADASSVRLGDAAVTFFDRERSGSTLDSLVPGLTARIDGYRNRL